MAFVESTDYNNSGKFDSKDLDISWAYIQIKKLYELEQQDFLANGAAPTITVANFLTKVREQYQKNKDTAIAEPSTDAVSKLPGEFMLGAPAPAPKLNFKHFFLFNDPTSGNDILDHSTGGRNSHFLKNTHLNPTAVDGSRQWIAVDNDFVIDDGGDLRSDRDWVLCIKGTCRNLSNVSIIKKGSFSFKSWKKGDYLQPNSIAAKAASDASGAVTIYHDKYAVKLADVVGVPMEMLIIREGMKLRIFMNGTEIAVGGDQPDPFPVDRYEPLILPGKCWAKLDKVYITEPTVKTQDVISVSGDSFADDHSWSFAHDMDITNSYYVWKQFFPDRFGSFGRINGYGWGHRNDQTWWASPPTGKDTSHGYVPKSTCLKIGHLVNKVSCNLPNINWSGDFTVSFWFLGGTTYEKFFKIGSANGVKLEMRWHWQKNPDSALEVIFNGSTKMLPVPTLGAGAGEKWQHLTIVKCGSVLTVFPNFGLNSQWNNFRNIDTSDTSNWGTGTPYFYCSVTTQAYHISHVRALNYAITSIPDYGKNKRSSLPELQVLNDPIEPGSVT